MTDTSTRVVYRYCEEVLSDDTFSNVNELLTPDFVIHGLQTLRGRERFLEVQSTVIRAAFPDLTGTVADLFGDEDTVTVRATLQGTHRGEYLGLEPTGNPVEVESMMICRLSGGRIAEVWTQMDSLAWFQQLGAVPPLEWQASRSRLTKTSR